MGTVRATFVIVFAAFLSMASSAAAQEAVQRSGLDKGSQALQFEIGYDFKLSPFQGATLSYERFLRDRFSLRVGAEINMDYTKGPRTVELEGAGSGSRQLDLTFWTHRYSLSCLLTSYRQGRVAFYYGGGPKVTYANDLREYFDYGVSGSTSITYQDRWWDHSWGVGLEGIVGAHWILNDRFRLQAQYSNAVMYGREFHERRYKRTEDTGYLTTYSKDTTTDDSYFFQVVPEGTHLGLSVSF
jgi:hypothetical protein